ncbi:MAG: hypothetical protein GF311_25105, partial [Candidatus Lokiarchaeota archaeon]|nr:hypothetical protein [Candidatus Lokiarchaeota archaeon]
MAKEKALTFKGIYGKHLSEFKEQIKSQYVDELFNVSKRERVELKTKHTKGGGEPEPLTETIIKEMLRDCEINPLDITSQKRIKGKNYSKFLKEIRKEQVGRIVSKVRKPDLFIECADGNDLLFEIEHLNKPLDKVGDNEGIEQALLWYDLDKGLINDSDAIVTNFVDWYLISWDFEKRDFDINSFPPWKMLEIIKNRVLGLGREYIIEENEEEKQEITTQFYNKFYERIKKLIGVDSKVEIDISIINYNKPDTISKKKYKQKLINYYRKIFSRLLFIKIIVSWKRLTFDPISESILDKRKRYWGIDLGDLFFEVFNKKPENRSSHILAEFK